MDGLSALSVRWIQPIQQHGRRLPSLSSTVKRFTWSSRVSSLFTDVVQQIHSLRESGVRVCHLESAALSFVSATFISAGTVCTTPVAIFSMHSIYQISVTDSSITPIRVDV